MAVATGGGRASQLPSSGHHGSAGRQHGRAAIAGEVSAYRVAGDSWGCGSPERGRCRVCLVAADDPAAALYVGGPDPGAMGRHRAPEVGQVERSWPVVR